jgi:hypothetical protein
VRDNLLQGHQLAPERCVLLPVGLPAAMAQPAEPPHEDPQSARVVVALREARARGAFLFGFLGQPLSRKGVDLFPLLLRECVEVFGEVPFRGAWIGCGEGSAAHAAPGEMGAAGGQRRVRPAGRGQRMGKFSGGGCQRVVGSKVREAELTQ